MRRMIVTLDNSLDDWLKTMPNQSETVREALRLYHGDITTGTVAGMREAFTQLLNEFRESQQRSVELYELLERVTNRYEELANR